MQHLLYIEDSDADFRLVERQLRQQGVTADIRRVMSTDELLAALPEQTWDAVLSDYSVPGMQFSETLALLRERLPETPVLLVSGTLGDEMAVHLLREGVADFILKDRLSRLAQALTRACEEAAQRQARRTVERALQESEERFRLIAATLAEVIWMCTRDLSRILYISPAYETVWQRSCTALYENPRSFLDAIHPDDRAITAQIIGNALERGESFSHEYRIVHPDGSIRWIYDHGFPVQGVAGGAYYTGVAQDITARHLSEERLRQAATVFENTQEAVVIAGLDGRIQAVNKAFVAITGHAEQDVLGHSPRRLLAESEETAPFQAQCAELARSGQWQGELWSRRRNGESFPCWLSISPVRDTAGRPTHYVGVFSDITLLKRNEEQLAHLAHYDPLTDLPNRLLLQSRLEQTLQRAGRLNQQASLLFIDLDRFKVVNDSFGHMVGDQLLIDVANRLRQSIIQPADSDGGEHTLGRFGGDEFLLVLAGGPAAATATAQQLLTALAQPFMLNGCNEVFLGASIGISVFPQDGDSAAMLLRNADTAMYQAKEQGRNRFCFYTATMNADAIAQLELEAALRRAIERNELLLHYQPKVDLRSGKVTGAEALIRWQRPDGSLEAPGRFIPLAEKTGLIVPIGTWVLDAACQQLHVWRGLGWDDLRLAINVSSRQFHSGDLPALVAAALARHDIPAASLELEVTESMLMEDLEQTIATLKQLRQIGVRLSLDDFGTGYSGFSYLSRFPINALKIDQSFVRDIVSEPEAAMIAVSIIDLAHRMHLKVIAEGVETAAQLGYLRQHRCDEIQGYYFSRPLPAPAFEALMHGGKTLPPTVAPSHERTVLLVDDEPGILSALRRLLRREDYRVLTAGSGQEGLELLATEPVQVILSDQRMPGMTGTDFLNRVKELHPDTVRIVLSGYSDLESVTRAVNEGAIYKFLHKPWDDDLLRQHLHEAFLYYEAVIKPRNRAAGEQAGHG